jgi:hypothetical protein
MKGPGRPQSMQTLGPPLARPEGSSAKTIAVLFVSGESDSGKVGTPTPWGEDWSVTNLHRVAIRSRNAAWWAA